MSDNSRLKRRTGRFFERFAGSVAGHGWYAADWLWRIRGWMDVLVGGPGLRRGRRDPETVGYGEALDFWRVIGFERDSRLALRAEMKLPGEALIEFCIEAQGSASALCTNERCSVPAACWGCFTGMPSRRCITSFSVGC